MDLLRCLVLIISFRKTLGTDFFISYDASDWTTATKLCQLAEPDLIYSSRGVTVNISVDILEDVWIGYYQARTAFEYFGCAATDNYKPTFRTKADPGQCMSACGANKIIGIFGNECFCFGNDEIHDDTQTMLPYCNMECKYLKGIVCGGPSEETGGTTYMSLYRSIGTNISSIGESGNTENCLYYEYRGFNWDYCSKSYAFTCGTESSAWIEDNYLFGNWMDATVKCFANKTWPSTYSSTRSIQTNVSTPNLWTGIMRSQVIYKYTNDLGHLIRASTYGYLHRTKDGNIVLKLSSFRDAFKKRLCVNVTDASTTTSPMSTSFSTISDRSSLSVKTPSVRTEKTSLPTSTTDVNNNTNSSSQLNNEDSSIAGIIVGATLSVIAMIVIVIVLVLYVRKRGFHQPCHKQEKQASPNMIQNDHAYVNTQSDDILHSSVDTNRTEYAEIDEADNGAEIDVINNDTTTPPVYSNDYFVIEKKACESTKPGNLNSDPNQPYEKLSFEESPNYENYGNAHT